MIELTWTIADWLRAVLTAHPPNDDIVAFVIGLFETEHGFAAYLSGASEYLETSDDWAVDPGYRPADAFLPLDQTVARWELCLSVVKQAVGEALSAGLLQGTALAKAQVVVVGFDDGDLHRVK